MTTYKEFLAQLSTYPAAYEIDEASNYAQDKSTEYTKSLDTDAVVTVEEGETYVMWCIDDEDGEFAANVQVTFDEAFSEKIFEMGYSE